MIAGIAGTATPAQNPVSEHANVITQYCVTCHNQRAKTAGLSLEAMDMSAIGHDAETWEKVVRKLRSGMMPPQGSPRPDDTTRKTLVSFLTTELDRAAVANPNPGRPLLSRLNRTQYANVIRDLLSLEVDPSVLLPPDDAAYGFDNIGDVLGVSPVLLERYMDAAGKVAALAVGDPDIGPSSETFRIRQDASQDIHLEGMPIGTIGGIRATVTLPLNGDYLL